MTTALYKEFVVTSGEVWRTITDFVRAAFLARTERDRRIVVIVCDDEVTRSTQQNRFYWGAVLATIHEQVFVDGRHYDTETWHEYFARKFCAHEDVLMPDGEVVSRRKSTAKMSVAEFNEYLSRVQAHAANEWGVAFA